MSTYIKIHKKILAKLFLPKKIPKCNISNPQNILRIPDTTNPEYPPPPPVLSKTREVGVFVASVALCPVIKNWFF